MTVRELIDELVKRPGNAPVEIYSVGDGSVLIPAAIVTMEDNKLVIIQ